MAKVKTQLVIEGKNSSQQAFREVNASLSKLDQKLSAAASTMRAAFSATFLTSAAREYAAMADESNQIAARLRLAAKSQDEFNKSMEDVRRIANENGAALSAVTQLYTQLSPSLREAGRTQREVVQVTEAVTKALRVSGASAAESEGAIRQFAQALGAGALRGDEFNSVAEQAPRLMQALADSLGVPTGALKQMAADGQLTADVIADALIKQLPQLSKEAEEFGVSFDTASVQVQNAALDMVGAFDRLTGTSKRATDTMQRLAKAMNDISSGDRALEGVANFMQEIIRQTPMVGAGLTLAEHILKRIEDASEGAADGLAEAADAAARHQLQLDMIEKDEIDRNIRRLVEDQRAAAERAGVRFDEVTALKGWAEAMGETYEGFIAREKERHALHAAAVEAGQAMISEARRGALNDLANNLKAQEKLANEANKKLESARKRTLDIEKEFQRLVADVRAGGRGTATYADAQDALLEARAAKRAGDTERAIEAARRAGEILKEMQEAGESSYGLEGMAKEIAKIATEAAKLEEVNFERDAKAVADRITTLKKEMEALKVVSVEVEFDDKSADQLKTRMLQLAADLARVMIIKPTIVGPDGTAPDEPPGFASGGMIRGPGTGTSDSVLARLSNGEFVMRAAAVKHYGPRLLELMNGMKLPRFADGGLVEAAVSAQPSAGRDLGRVELSIGGENFSLLADAPNFDRVLRRAALKRGRPRIN